MDYLQALILSFIEGLTEFLPISSTGHLILANDLLGIPNTDFVKSFEIFIQLGAILAVFVLYWKIFIRNPKIIWKVLFAFLPTAGIGFVFYKLIKQYLLGNSMVVLVSLFIGGLILIFLEIFYKERQHSISEVENLSWPKAFLIGCFQAISVIPGVSRAAATIIGGLFAGLRRKAAVEFSFLLAIPTMAAASCFDLIKSGINFSQNEFWLLAGGFLGSLLTAVFAVKYFLKFIQTHTFVPFGVYRILLAAVFFIFILN